jgi:hypothetical protein
MTQLYEKDNQWHSVTFLKAMASAEFEEMLAIVRASQEYREELEGLVFSGKNDSVFSLTIQLSNIL